MGQLGRNSITSCGRCMVELPVGTRMIWDVSTERQNKAFCQLSVFFFQNVDIASHSLIWWFSPLTNAHEFVFENLSWRVVTLEVWGNCFQWHFGHKSQSIAVQVVESKSTTIGELKAHIGAVTLCSALDSIVQWIERRSWLHTSDLFQQALWLIHESAKVAGKSVLRDERGCQQSHALKSRQVEARSLESPQCEIRKKR